MKDLKALMGKEDEGNSGMKKNAKLTVLTQLRKMAADMMGDDVKGGLDGMKKVTVAAPDSDGLAEGLAKAKAMMGEEHDMDMEDSEDEMMEESEMTPEEMKMKIAELEAKLASR